MTRHLIRIYHKLLSSFGPQHWWPADTAFEVIVGAILTQNTSWLNVEKAVNNLKKNKVLTPKKLCRLKPQRLADLIRPAGYYNIKAKRLKAFLDFFLGKYHLNLKEMSRANTAILREQLLGINGIGPETADSILLYALKRPVFVVDAYTKRIFSRHGMIKAGAAYEEIQNLLMTNLKKDIKLFNEFHALIVRLAKGFCLKNKPRCPACPLNFLNNKNRNA